MPDRLTISRAAPPAPPALLGSAVACTPAAGSLVEVLRQAAAECPAALYLDLLDEKGQPHERSFRAVWHGAERWARWLRARPVPRGARIALLLPTGDDFVGAFFGAQLAGAIPVPLPFPLGLGNPEKLIAALAGIVASARPDLLIAPPHLAGAA
ncbi:MAG TPA: AMP-binding protein, partial [Polyangia bacterium]